MSRTDEATKEIDHVIEARRAQVAASGAPGVRVAPDPFSEAMARYEQTRDPGELWAQMPTEPERMAFLEWKAAVIALRQIHLQMQAAQQRVREAHEKMAAAAVEGTPGVPAT